MKDYYLVVTEHCNAGPFCCNILRRLEGKLPSDAMIVPGVPAPRNDFALVQLESPIPGALYGKSHDLTEVVLAARHRGRTLFPPTEVPIDWDSRNPLWPIVVMVFCLSRPIRSNEDEFDVRNLAYLDFGVLSHSYKDVVAWLDTKGKNSANTCSAAEKKIRRAKTIKREKRGV